MDNETSLRKKALRIFLNNNLPKAEFSQVNENFDSVQKKIAESDLELIKYFLLCYREIRFQFSKEDEFSLIFQDLDEVDSLYMEYITSKQPYLYNQLKYLLKDYRDDMLFIIQECKSKIFKTKKEFDIFKL